MTQSDTFNATAARMYDFGSPGEEARQGINFFLHYAIRAGTVLEVGAGTGRVALPLAEHGIHVTCVEPSRAMTDALMVKIAQKPQTQQFITPICGDPTSFKLKQRFKLGYMFWTFFYMDTDEERLKVLRNMAEHLEPGGLLILDAPIGSRPDIQKMEVKKFNVGAYEFRMAMSQKKLEAGRFKGTGHFETWFNGELVSSEDVDYKGADIPSYEYLQDMLKKAGLSIQEAFNGTDFNSPYTPRPAGEQSYVVVVARKS